MAEEDEAMTKRASVLGVVAACAFGAAALAEEYKEIEVANGGKVTGVVKWAGDRPTLAPMTVAKDVDHCGGEAQTPSPRLKIAESGGVTDAVVYLVAPAQGKKLDALGAEFVLDQVKCVYVPHVLVIPARREVQLLNSDPILHNVHATGIKEFNYGMPLQGKKVPEKLKKPGILRLACDAGHTWMSATIHVVSHPYYAVTDADGRFVLANVPPGKYQVAMWHEGWHVKEVKKNGDEITGYEFAPDVTEQKEVTVPEAGEATVEFELRDAK